MTWTKESIATWLKAVEPTNEKHRDAVGRALLFMYQRQTADEREIGATSHNNGMGFSGCDAEFLSSVAQRYQQYGKLSEKQVACVAKALVKYSGQLTELSS